MPEVILQSSKVSQTQYLQFTGLLQTVQLLKKKVACFYFCCCHSEHNLTVYWWYFFINKEAYASKNRLQVIITASLKCPQKQLAINGPLTLGKNSTQEKQWGILLKEEWIMKFDFLSTEAQPKQTDQKCIQSKPDLLESGLHRELS